MSYIKEILRLVMRGHGNIIGSWICFETRYEDYPYKVFSKIKIGVITRERYDQNVYFTLDPSILIQYGIFNIPTKENNY